MNTSLSKLSFGIMVVLVLLLSFLLVTNTVTYDILSREDHLAEYISALFLLIASLFFFKSLFFLISEKQYANKLLLIIVSFCAVVFFMAAGEEISWGQRLFDIPTPEYLKQVNDQNELNLHNINKRFFDRLLDRLTILLVLIGSILLILQKDKILSVKAPNVYIICCFAITPFYRQQNNLNFHHSIYIALIALLGFYIIKKMKQPLWAIITTILITIGIQIIHSKYHHLFPLHNNSANEFKEFLFSGCLLLYSYEIMLGIISSKEYLHQKTSD